MHAQHAHELFVSWDSVEFLTVSASQIRCKIQEQHSEVWLQKCIQYMTDCQGFSTAAATGLILPLRYEELAPVPQYRWLLQVYAQDVVQRIEEVKSNVITLLGNILKIDSTKKVVKKLAVENSKNSYVGHQSWNYIQFIKVLLFQFTLTFNISHFLSILIKRGNCGFWFLANHLLF